jgi:hypothetical protein
VATKKFYSCGLTDLGKVANILKLFENRISKIPIIDQREKLNAGNRTQFMSKKISSFN